MKSRAELEIREADFADPAHRSAIVEVLDTYAADPIGAGAPLAAEIRERLVSGLRDHPAALVLLAFAERRAVGIAVCFFGFSTFQALPLLNIHDLAVIPECRGNGIGRALLRAAEAHALRRGCGRLTLEVRDDNTPARALYASFGFTNGAGNSTLTRFLSKPLRAAGQRG